MSKAYQLLNLMTIQTIFGNDQDLFGFAREYLLGSIYSPAIL